MQRDDIFLASPSLASQSLLHPVPGCRVGTTSGVSFPEPHRVPPHRGLEFGMAQPIRIRDGTRVGWVNPAVEVGGGDIPFPRAPEVTLSVPRGFGHPWEQRSQGWTLSDVPQRGIFGFGF